MSGPRIGALRHRLVIERPQRAPDEGGGATVTWIEEAVVWAAIRPLGGHERLEADRISGRVGHEIAIRYRPGLDPSFRFRLGDRVFAIESAIDVEERRAFLKCLCVEETA